MQTPMTFIKSGLTLNYWILGIPIKVKELPNSFKVKISFHIVEYARLIMLALFMVPFFLFKAGKYN